jgi:hypothetical protein
MKKRVVTVIDVNIAINVIQKPGETVSIYRQILRDRKRLKISNGARFLHCLLRALETTPGWKITVAGLCTEMQADRKTIIKYINELRDSELVETDLVYKEVKGKLTNMIEGYLWTIWPLPKWMCEQREIG